MTSRTDTALRFADRVAIIAGAGSGIGHATAALLRAEGAHVVAADIDPTGVPDGCLPRHVNVADEGSVEDLVQTTLRQFGRVDVMCNNAGIGSTADPIGCTTEEWDRVFAVNARGVFLGTRAVLPSMLRQASGAVVNTASVAGLTGLRDRAAYCASKGAVVAFTKAVALQYADRGVRCNCVCPGTVDSPWVRRILDASADPETARAELVARQPMGRLAEPAEVAGAIAYLASDDARYVTGSALVIDGGMLAGVGPPPVRLPDPKAGAIGVPR